MNINNVNDNIHISPSRSGEGVIDIRANNTETQDVTADSEESDEPGHGITDIQNIAGRLNEQMVSRNIAMRFYIHEATNEVVVKIIDNNSHEVIKEIPSSEMLDLKGRIDEMVGLLLDKKI